MEDSTAKTITYLRARLLAERSVSRTAKQRANELAKRVTELEKQLKFVSLQRKKAEKATVDVLAILENHGRNDLSEPFDSSSDQEEMSSDFKDDDKRVETSKKHGKVLESDTEGFSGSEVESSSVNGRSLSWKSSKNSSARFLEKYMDASRRRRNSFASTGSSPRRVGKSCRQIRHKEHRSAAEGSENDATNAHREDEGRTSSEGVQNSADVATETSIEEHRICDEKSPPEILTSLCNGHISQNNGTKRDMERALEHHAQFIAQFEAEEKAQREWEDKFRENNGSTPDSCDPGTHSDVTEERDEIKTPPPPPAPAPSSSNDKFNQEGQQSVGVVDANFIKEPKIDTEPLLNQKNSDIKTEGSDDRNHPPEQQGTSGNFSPVQPSLSRDCSLLCREKRASDESFEPTLGTQKKSDHLGSVLEALQQAKLSLKQNLNSFPLLENGPPSKFPLLESGLSVPTYKSGDKYPVPFSPVGLFRLPTDYEYGEITTNRVNSLTNDARLSLTNYPTDTSGDQFISSPYRESLSRSVSSLDDRFRMVPTFPYQETRLETPSRPQSQSVFNPTSDVPPSVTDPRFSVHPSTLDPRLSFQPSATYPRSDVPPSRTDPRSDTGMGRSAYDPRSDAGIGRSAYDPRSDAGMGRSAYDPRSDAGMGRSAYDPRSDAGMGRAAYDPRSDVGAGMGRPTYDPRSDVGMGRPVYDPKSDTGMGQSAYDPILDAGMGRSASGMPASSIYGRMPRSLPGGDIPLRTRSMYDDYSRPNM